MAQPVTYVSSLKTLSEGPGDSEPLPQFRLSLEDKQHILSPWKPRVISGNEGALRMVQNAQKAWNEYVFAAECAVSYVPSPPKIEMSFSPSPPLSHNISMHSVCGKRPTMEDSSFFTPLTVNETCVGILAGLFDGHGGSDVSTYCKEHFASKCIQKIANGEKSMYSLFEQVFFEIQNEIASDSRLARQGSTAVVSYLDLVSRVVYIATLGDSEATLYRDTPDASSKKVAIPLSCVRTWCSKQDCLRAFAAYPDTDRLAQEWDELPSKFRRYPPYPQGTGINVSRAIGDTKFGLAISHKPKISAYNIQERDILVLACDGLKDFSLEKEIAEELASQGSQNDGLTMAQHLTWLAIKSHSDDNVSVVAIELLAPTTSSIKT